MDVYNGNLWPHDTKAKEAIKCQVELENHTSDTEYLSIVEKCVDFILLLLIFYGVMKYNFLSRHFLLESW